MKRSLDDEYLWGIVQGLMLGIAIMHAEQPIAVFYGDLDMKLKIWVSVFGGVLYTGTFLGLYFRERWALFVTIFGPLVGLTSVMLIGADVDTFQVMCGIAQFYAAGTSFKLLYK